MPNHKIALIVAAVCCFGSALITTLMRSQVHRALYPGERIESYDRRFVNDLPSIWTLHKQLFEQSLIRQLFVVLSASGTALLFFGLAVAIWARSMRS